MQDWLVPVLVGLIGLGGVLVGQRGSRELDRQRWDREQQTRWHTERYAAYSSLMGAVSEWHRLLSVKPTRNDKTYQELMTALDQVRSAQGSVEILGSEDVRQTFDLLWKLYTPLTVLYAEENEAPESHGGRTMKEHIDEARDLLASEMRRDLDVPDRPPLFPKPSRWFVARRKAAMWTKPSVLRLRWYIWREKRKGTLGAGREPDQNP